MRRPRFLAVCCGAAAFLLMTAGSARAAGETTIQPADDDDPYPTLEPSLGINGGMGGTTELTEGTGSLRFALGARVGLNLRVMEQLAWANSIGAELGFLPKPHIGAVVLRTGIQWDPVVWAYLGVNALVEFYPDLGPGIEPVVGLGYPVSAFRFYAEMRVPVMFLEDDPVDVVFQVGTRVVF